MRGKRTESCFFLAKRRYKCTPFGHKVADFVNCLGMAACTIGSGTVQRHCYDPNASETVACITISHVGATLVTHKSCPTAILSSHVAYTVLTISLRVWGLLCHFHVENTSTFHYLSNGTVCAAKGPQVAFSWPKQGTNAVVWVTKLPTLSTVLAWLSGW